MSTIIETHELVKTYHDGTQALKSINLNVEEGEIIGLIGPNGAGKTTFINLILGLLKPTSGIVKVWNQDSYTLSKVQREKIGFLLSERGLYRDLTVEENLIFWSMLYEMGTNHIEKYLKKWNLWEKRKKE